MSFQARQKYFTGQLQLFNADRLEGFHGRNPTSLHVSKDSVYLSRHPGELDGKPITSAIFNGSSYCIKESANHA